MAEHILPRQENTAPIFEPTSGTWLFTSKASYQIKTISDFDRHQEISYAARITNASGVDLFICRQNADVPDRCWQKATSLFSQNQDRNTDVSEELCAFGSCRQASNPQKTILAVRVTGSVIEDESSYWCPKPLFDQYVLSATANKACMPKLRHKNR